MTIVSTTTTFTRKGLNLDDEDFLSTIALNLLLYYFIQLILAGSSNFSSSSTISLKMSQQLLLLFFFFFFLLHSKQAVSDFIVDKNGSGNFRTISEAIKNSPSNSAKRFHIKILKGIYEENIIIGEDKINLVLVGEGIDKTIISGNRSARSGFKTYDTATVGVIGYGFTAKEITFENTAGPKQNQAVALRCEANHASFFRCKFKGYQDTLYAKNGHQFYRDCDIEGTIDFICGDATVVLQNCLIAVHRPLLGQSNTITAQKRDKSNIVTGTIIHNSTIIAAADLKQASPRAKTYLGRPWGNFAITVVMESYLADLVDPKGWLEWEDRRTDKVYYAEFRNKGPGANTRRRVPWSKVIQNSSEAELFTVKRFIHGESWIPKDIPFISGLLE
ncbi:hypothetical protein M9H77_33050 [Catharanthus roseus]|uniref:Uncharacterized protein n=1 Tax=Catharanthus roseus TaxID=4058 RepID=A0ACC0A783_CATRO|nr:hypothetical protein M9H77_33050 [Catharanthus roseus]